MNNKKKKPVLAYHFVGDKLRDGRPVPANGVWLEHDGPLKLCESGLHASLSPFDALQYAPGETICLVECGGDIVYGNDKLVCRRRRIVKRFDATEIMHYFARMCALEMAHLWDAPDVVLDYLITGDENLRAAAWAAARAAAWDEARAAAWDEARAAARAAAGAAAWDAAGAAAWATAWDAARAAARAAAWAAAWATAWDAARAAAWAAARAAARDAAWDAQSSFFNELVETEFNSIEV